MENKNKSYLMNYFLIESGLRKLCAQCGHCCSASICEAESDDGCRNDTCLYYICPILDNCLRQAGISFIADMLRNESVDINSDNIIHYKQMIDNALNANKRYLEYPILEIVILLKIFRKLNQEESKLLYKMIDLLRDSYWFQGYPMQNTPKQALSSAHKFDKETYDYLNSLK